MAVEIDEAWLTDHGVDLNGLTGQKTDELIDAAMDELELRVGMEIADNLTDKQIAEFEAIDNEDARIAWLDKVMPDYPGIVDRKFEELGKDLDKSTDKIALLRGWTAEG